MMCRASMASSRAVIRCSGSWRPVELRKVDFLQADPARLVVHALGEGGSLPAMFSATEMPASLPDCTMMPWSSS